MRVVISILVVLEDNFAPMIFWKLECHTIFGVACSCARKSGWLVTTC